jgi:hypothetical protein
MKLLYKLHGTGTASEKSSEMDLQYLLKSLQGSVALQSFAQPNSPNVSNNIVVQSTTAIIESYT